MEKVEMQMRLGLRHSERLFIWRRFPFIKSWVSLRAATNSFAGERWMHFSHGIIVVYWSHKFLLHNSGGELWWLAVDVREYGRVERGTFLLHVFLLAVFSGSRRGSNNAVHSPVIVNVSCNSGLHRAHVYSENHKLHQKKAERNHNLGGNVSFGSQHYVNFALCSARASVVSQQCLIKNVTSMELLKTQRASKKRNYLWWWHSGEWWCRESGCDHKFSHAIHFIYFA